MMGWTDLPPATVQLTKEFVLDTVACGVAGSSAEGVQAGLGLVRSWSGTPQATVLVFGDRVPAPAAALLNGTMCQARDFDAVYEPGALLCFTPVVAATLAAAELEPGTTGRDLIVAIALGADLACRIAGAARTGLGWSRTATAGTFGAALATSKILGLTEGEIINGLGLALSQAAGSIQPVIEGTLAKRYQAGFAAERGLVASLLAREGVTGPADSLEGRFGYFQLYERGEYDRTVLLDGLGVAFEGSQASLKPYPCARECHGAAEAALRLVEAHRFVADDISTLTVDLPNNAFSVSGRPFTGGSRTVSQAIASAAYVVAVAITNRSVTLDAFETTAITDSAAAALAERVIVRRIETIADPKTLVPQIVHVRLRDGREFSASIGTLLGGPSRRLAVADVEAKVDECARRSVTRLRGDWPRELIRFIGHLDLLNNASDLLAFVNPSR
jgi:2-methylcitrate dehydratase PrpD